MWGGLWRKLHLDAQRRRITSGRRAPRFALRAELGLTLEPLERRFLLTAPSVLSIDRLDPTDLYTDATSVQYAVTFSEAVTGVDASDFGVATTGGLAVTSRSVSGGGSDYTVTIAGISGSGGLRLDLLDDDSIENTTSESLGGSGNDNGSFHGPNYFIDQTGPIVQSIVRTNPAGPTTGSPHVTYTVTFNKPVVGVDPADFTFATTGSVAAAPLVEVSGSGSEYTVIVSDIVGSGSLELSLVDNRTIHDVVGNRLGDHDRSVSFAGQIEYSAGLVPISVTVADLDADTNPDLIVANFLTNDLSILMGNGDGTFQPQSTIPVGSNPQSVNVNDFNGDGDADLAVANFGNNNIGVLLGHGDGTFDAQVIYPTGANPQSVTSSELNGDGKADLLVVNSASGSMSVLLGVGNGTFLPQTAYATGPNPSALAVGDINSDDTLDVVTANVGNGTLGVLLGLGNGTFFSSSSLTAGSDPQSVAIFDANHDNIADLVVANAGSNNLRVFRGTGFGAFPAHDDYPTGSNPQSVAVADMNGDGTKDLVVANFDDDTLGVLLGNADGTFQPQTTVATGANPQSVAVWDVNADSRPDLVVANFIGGTASVILGNATGDFSGQAYTMQAATGLAFLTVPPPTLTGAPLGGTTGIQVATLDETDAIVSENDSTVMLTLVGGTFSGGGTTALAPAIDGVATFTGLVIDAPGTYSLVASDGLLTPASTPDFLVAVSSTIVNRRLFYHGSSFNVTNNNLPGFSDDNAIAPDKSAYLPGTGTATFSNVSSYLRGINGVVVDIAGPHGPITANDFTFHLGNNNSPTLWPTAAAPVTVTMRPGAGVGGSDRVELIWADNAIEKKWLEVRIRGNDSLGGSNTNTGLSASDVFYFGNAIGDSGAGNMTGFLVNSADQISARNDPHGLGNPAPISNVNDFTRDGQVNANDQTVVTAHATSVATQVIALTINVPPTANAGGPYEIYVGQSLQLNGSGEDLDPLAVLTFSWDINGDGTFGDATGAAPNVNSTQLAALGINSAMVISNVRVRVSDGVATTTSAPTSLTVLLQSSVVGRHLFYAGSTKWNVTNGNMPGFSDDNAIAPDKTAYLPGSGHSTFANVSSYIRGINGLMVDLSGSHGPITANDFIFKIGNNNAPSHWATAPAPTAVTVRAGAGIGGSDRVELFWANAAISGVWLEVLVRGNDAVGGSNSNTGLSASDVFFFGSAPGDSSGGDTSGYLVSSTDEVWARNDPHSVANPASITTLTDYDRDGLVNTADQIAARNFSTSVVTQLKFLDVGGGGPFAPALASESSLAAMAQSPGKLSSVPWTLPPVVTEVSSTVDTAPVSGTLALTGVVDKSREQAAWLAYYGSLVDTGHGPQRGGAARSSDSPGTSSDCLADWILLTLRLE